MADAHGAAQAHHGNAAGGDEVPNRANVESGRGSDFGDR